MWGVPAYTMQGLHAEVNKHFGRSVHNYIMTSRVVQGKRDLAEASAEERTDIVSRWHKSKAELKGFYMLKRKDRTAEKAPADSEHETTPAVSPCGWMHTLRTASEDWKKQPAQRGLFKLGLADLLASQATSGGGSSGRQSASSGDAEYEQAIQASVQETSRGNTEEDAMVEVAMRESVWAMRQRGSLPESAPGVAGEDTGPKGNIFQDEEYQMTDEEYQSLIEMAIQQSLASHVAGTRRPWDSGSGGACGATGSGSAGAGHGSARSGPHDDGGDDDAELLRAIEESKKTRAAPRAEDESEDELRRAMEASREHLQRETSQRTEEEIVLEYVKRQSLAEEEYRRRMGRGRGAAAGRAPDDGDDDDDELKRALEESLGMHGGGGSASCD